MKDRKRKKFDDRSREFNEIHDFYFEVFSRRV